MVIKKKALGRILKKVNGIAQSLNSQTGRWLGLTHEQRYEAFLAIVKSSNPFDMNYWLELFFSCGIATLGLVLNSPAVIIGAMLISPLMGPILGTGLALAVGDVFLGARAFLNLIWSILASVAASTVLVYLLPFKELTPEIGARIQPNALDLGVAVLCGLAASFATLKSVKGLVTAIPGVAIAVALMPPLSVVGFGLGVRGVLPKWWEIAQGGGLLFAANLIAIVLTSMLVFLFVRMSQAPVREGVDAWQRDPEHQTPLELWLAKTKFWKKVERIGTLPARLLVVFVFLALIFQPLYRSLGQLTASVSEKRTQESQMRTINSLAEEIFGEPDFSEVEKVTVTHSLGKAQVEVQVRVSEWMDETSKKKFEEVAAAKIGKPVKMTLVQIPSDFGQGKKDWAGFFGFTRTVDQNSSIPLPLKHQLHWAFSGLFPHDLISWTDWQIRWAESESPGSTEEIVLTYLAEKELSVDAKAVIAHTVVERTGFRSAIRWNWVPQVIEIWKGEGGAFGRRRPDKTLEKINEILKAHPQLELFFQTEGEGKSFSARRARKWESEWRAFLNRLERNSIPTKFKEQSLLPLPGQGVSVRLRPKAEGSTPLIRSESLPSMDQTK